MSSPNRTYYWYKNTADDPLNNEAADLWKANEEAALKKGKYKLNLKNQQENTHKNMLQKND